MKIIGFIDTFNEEEGFSGWACFTEKPGDNLEFSFLLNGIEEDISVTAVERQDLKHLGSGAHGFILRLRNDHPDLHRQNFAIRARLRGAPRGAWHPLAPGNLLLEQMARSAWMSHLTQLNHDQLQTALAEVSMTLSSASTTRIEPRVDMAQSALRGTPVLLPVGLKSLDKSLIMGEKGHAFLVGGSNNVLASLEQSNTADHKEQARKWADLFAARDVGSRQRNICYVQCVIPEKISVMPEISGLQIEAPGPALRFLEQHMLSGQIAYPSLLNSLRQEERRYDMFDQIDTHLSASGAFLCFTKILEALDIRLPIMPDFVTPEIPILGDVSDRFFDIPLLCTSEAVNRVPAPLSDDTLRLMEEYDPQMGGHIGIRRIFENKGAPIQKKVVAFANSFFERGGAPKGLTWWFARTFREFHFIWSPDFDWKYVDNVAPDILIGQTIERFLTRIPNS